MAEVRLLYRRIRDTPSTGTHTLQPRPVEEQQGICHHEEERDPVPASRPGTCDDEKGSILGGESIRGGVVHAANTHVVKLHSAPIELFHWKVWWA